MSFLQKILPSKQAEVRVLEAEFARQAPVRDAADPVRDFAAALHGGQRLIAEIKGKSPSHPAFRQPASPAHLARCYGRNGAAALSIVTDAAHFGTSLADVAPVRAAVGLPVIVKDFVIDEVQLLAAWAAGADAVLLIVRMLDGRRLAELLRCATGLGLHVLVECHDRADIELALAAEARLIGVNNRNLATLTTDLAHGAAMLPHVARPALRVSESGLYVRADIEHMSSLGADAFLVGHALLGSADPGRKVAELCGREDETAVRIKTCGITTAADARLARDAGAHVLGLIFAPGPRQVDWGLAARIRAAVPDARLCGVFVDAPTAAIAAAATAGDLDLIQLHGRETPEDCRAALEATGCPVIKALTADRATPDVAATFAAAAYFLVDLPKATGSTGEGSTQSDAARLTAADCRAAARGLAAAGHEVFLAGGLEPANVGAAIRETAPFGVDVARGIESGPGCKDPVRLRAFIREATT